MNKGLRAIVNLLKEDLLLFLSISLAIFLFVLFFQPFSLDRFDFNNKLVFVAGLGGIVFLFMVLIRVLSHLYNQDQSFDSGEFSLPSFLAGFLLLVLTSVAFAFYLRYVGLVSISFHAMFKVVIICLAPPFAIHMYDSIKTLRNRNKALLTEKKEVQAQLEEYEQEYQNKSIEFISESSNESITLLIADVAFVRSADNYVEIIYKEAGNFSKKLIRNTLRNIERLLKPYSNFIRCHRVCIVNKYFIEKLDRNHNSHWLTIKGFDEHLPVSRQHLLILKESI